MFLCLLLAMALNINDIKKMGFGSVPEILAFLAFIFSQSQISFNMFWKKNTMREAMQIESVK